MTTEKMFHGLGHGELQVHQAAVAQHHDKKAQAPPRLSDGDRTVFAPVHLGGFTGFKRQLQKGWCRSGSDASHIVSNNGDTTIKTTLLESLVDLGSTVGMCFQPGNDLLFMRIQFAGSSYAMSRLITWRVQPAANSLLIDTQGLSDLLSGKMAFMAVLFDLAVGLIANHRSCRQVDGWLLGYWPWQA